MIGKNEQLMNTILGKIQKELPRVKQLKGELQRFRYSIKCFSSKNSFREIFLELNEASS